MKFYYQYRDRANYKIWDCIVFSNPNNLSLSVIDNELRSLLVSEEFFIAHQVDIRELFFYLDRPVSDDDHCYHEYVGVEATIELATDKRLIDDFIATFRKEAQKGWLAFDPNLHQRRHHLI